MTHDLGRADGEKHPGESTQQTIRKFFPTVLFDKVPNELQGKETGHIGKAEITYKIKAKELHTFDFGNDKNTITIQIEDIRFSS